MSKNVLALCLGTVAAAGAASAYAQDASSLSAPYALAPSVGVVFMNLPDMDTGVQASGIGDFHPTISGLDIGVETGLNFGAKVGEMGGNDLLLGLTMTGAFSGNNSSSKNSFTGPGVVAVNSYSPPTTSINLVTNSNGVNSTSTVTGTVTDISGTGAINSTLTSAGYDSAIHFTPTGGGGTGAAFDALVDRGPNSAAAFYAAATPDGATFLAVGDLTGLNITSGINEAAFQTGADITFGMGGGEGNTYLQGYVGPTVRYLGRNIDSSTTFDIPETAGGPSIPEFSFNRYEDLNTTYYGGLVGLSLTQMLDSGMSFTLGAEGGVYGFTAIFAGREQFSLPNGTGGLFTVTSNTKEDEQANGVAWFARAQAATTLPVSQNSSLTFAGSLGYLSKVPTISRSNNPTYTNTQAGDDANLTFSSTAGTNDNANIGFGSMWNFGVSASLTTSF